MQKKHIFYRIVCIPRKLPETFVTEAERILVLMSIPPGSPDISRQPGTDIADSPPSLTDRLMPARVTTETSWIGHMPFALWLMPVARPEQLVELGTYTGNSYFAFCQGIQQNRLHTRCCAVDTWRGDRHAGFYGNDVFTEVNRYNNAHYSHFSHLMRMTFDNAAPLFADGSIDILHIDGLHTYEAVRHDVETWLPKLSERGILLLHDIGVTGHDFGVWKLWGELTEHYPHFSFDHCNGLGVALVGNRQPEILLKTAAREKRHSGVCHLKQMVSSLGKAFELEHAPDDGNPEQRALRISMLRHAALAAGLVLGYRNGETERPAPPGTQQQLASLEREAAQQRKTIEHLQHRIGSLEQEKAELTSRLARLKRSRSWKMTKPIRKWSKSVRKRSRKLRRWALKQSPSEHNHSPYQEWLRLYDKPATHRSSGQEGDTRQPVNQPLISVIMPVYNPPITFFEEAIRSVLGQSYSNWELCIADDNSPDGDVQKLIELYAERDSRIRPVFRPDNGHISEASNSALDQARGEFIALFDHDDLLHPHALAEIAREIRQYPDAGIIYSDEDKIDEQGARHSPYFKPDFNYELFLCQNMISHLGAYRTSLVRSIGGFRKGLEGSQDWDLALRAAERLSPDRIRHIPKVLYHWRCHDNSTATGTQAKPYTRRAALKAVQEHLDRRGIQATAEESPGNKDFNRIRYHIDRNPPSVEIIILTRDKPELLEPCVASIRRQTTYPDYRITIVDNGSVEPETLRLLEDWQQDACIRVLRDDSPFNYSRLNNRAASASTADYLCLMNNDIEVISPDWLEEMVSHAVQKGVGAVGSRLWYPDGTLQHAGVVMGPGGVAAHVHHGIAQDNPGYFGRAILQQNFTALTGACLLVAKKLYLKAGGLNEEHLTVAFNDIDFCLKLHSMGLRNVWTPYAEFYHHESASRGQDDTPEKQRRFQSETIFMQQNWPRIIERDPAYNPNLSVETADFSLA
ncbi:glycosyltransferase [Prosthecochloris sp. ZM_2]|nr:glycosyltransferase [Prosthecochloris sp. ZM_2]